MPGTWNSPQASNDSFTREAEPMVLLILVVRGVNFRGYGTVKLGFPQGKVVLWQK